MVVPYKRFIDEAPFDAIVIGSGIGGLATAALLAKAGGRRVLVLERHYTAGGCTHVFRRPGFEWDVGVHYVGQVHEPGSQARALFDYLSEERLMWEPMPDVYDRVKIADRYFEYRRGRDRLRDALVEAFPDEVAAIDGYFASIARCLRRMPLYFVEKVLPPLPSWLIGGALRSPFVRVARRTTREVLDGLRATPELQAVLTAQWGDYGLPPGRSSFAIHALVASHYFDGAAYPVGGASQILAALLPTIESAGGAVVVNAEVTEVLLDGQRAIGVRMADGRELRAAAVVSDIGALATLERLVPRQAAPDVQPIATRLRALEPSLAHCCLYVGVDTSALRAPLPEANLWCHPGPDFDANLTRFEHDIAEEFPFVFISFPSAKDPTFNERHRGHATIEVATLTPYGAFKRWERTEWRKRSTDYESMKRDLGDRLLRALHRHVPGLDAAITRCEISTPLSTRHFLGAAYGEIYGVAHTPARFVSRDLRPRTPIANLFLTGQDIGTCGVMGAISGAVTAASVVLRRNLFGEIARLSSGRAPLVASTEHRLSY
jgi:all-trans-retinol 13,14-reductase